MSGYKPGYSERHSPFWHAGLADGHHDGRCFRPENMNGPDPDKSWSAMYMRGYRVGFSRSRAAKWHRSRGQFAHAN